MRSISDTPLIPSTSTSPHPSERGGDVEKGAFSRGSDGRLAEGEGSDAIADQRPLPRLGEEEKGRRKVAKRNHRDEKRKGQNPRQYAKARR